MEVPDAGQNFTVSASDSVGITDSLSASIGYFKSISDSVGITDAISSLKVQLVGVWTVTRNFGRRFVFHPILIASEFAGQNLTRSISESVGITDSLTRVLGKVVSLSDSVGITDTITAAISFARSISNQMG